RAFELENDPGLVRLDPRWHQAAGRFVALGFRHILGGVDHLLFLLCLVIPFRRLRPLVIVVSAFTVAHSITLLASALGLAPARLSRRVPERSGTIVLSALAAHTGWHWMADRWERLRQFPFSWPALDAARLASATRWLMLAIAAAGLFWLWRAVLSPVARRRV